MLRRSSEAHDRLRLIHATTPKRVLVLLNLSLDLIVDEVVRLGNIAPDKGTRVAMRHVVLPLAKTDRHYVVSKLFAAADESKHWLSRRGRIPRGKRGH
jgi:hypothetical protein